MVQRNIFSYDRNHTLIKSKSLGHSNKSKAMMTALDSFTAMGADPRPIFERHL